MARRPNYGFEKRQKELERQKKKDAKAAKKQQRREGGDSGASEDGGEAPVNGEIGTEQDRPE